MGETQCENNENWMTIVLAIIWVFFHAIVLLDIKFPSIMTNHVRFAAPR